MNTWAIALANDIPCMRLSQPTTALGVALGEAPGVLCSHRATPCAARSRTRLLIVFSPLRMGASIPCSFSLTIDSRSNPMSARMPPVPKFTCLAKAFTMSAHSSRSSALLMASARPSLRLGDSRSMSGSSIHREMNLRAFRRASLRYSPPIFPLSSILSRYRLTPSCALAISVS